MTASSKTEPLPPNITFQVLWRLAWPSILFAILRHGYRIVDQFYAQYISMEAQAAIGSTTYFQILASGLFTIIAFGAAPLIGRAVGSQDTERLRIIVNSALAGVVVLSITAIVLGSTGTGLIVRGLGLSGETANEAQQYIFTLCLTMPPLVLAPFLDQALIASGDTRTPMKSHAIILCVNLILTPTFIMGLDLGVVGAALSSTSATALGSAYSLSRLFRIAPFSPDVVMRPTLIRPIIRVGTPIGLGVAAYALTYWGILATTVSPMGPHVNAALGIGFSALEGVTWPAFHGFSLAIASLVGRSLGAQRTDLAWVSVRKGIYIASALGIVASATFYFGQSALTGIFTKDPLVHQTATEYAAILAFSQFAVALEAILEGVLSGSGATRSIFWASTPINLMRIPLGWYFAIHLGYGPAGLWWVLNGTTYAKVIWKALIVRSGRWSTLQL